MQTKRIFTFKAKDGMVVAEDIINNSGQLLVSKGTPFTSKTKSILTANSIIEITVFYDEVKPDTPSKTEFKPKQPANSVNPSLTPAFLTSEVSFEQTLSQRIRNSLDYQKYVRKYAEGLKDFKMEINDIVDKNTAIDPTDILDIPFSILKESGTSYHIFDMLHNLNAYDDSTYAHSLNVALICSVFADWLHFSEEDKNALVFSGIIHDIGKIQIPDQIIKKPSRLTDAEYEIIKSHPALGYNIVKNRVSDPRIKAAVLMHHEKCDGSGYPSHLHGDKIPAFAKIVTIADVYDAMTSNRVYRGALCPFEVIRMFENEGFQKYDARFILTFLSNVGQTYLNNSVELSDGSVGKIVLINQNHLSKPTIIVDDSYIDLSKNNDLSIVNIL